MIIGSDMNLHELDAAITAIRARGGSNDEIITKVYEHYVMNDSTPALIMDARDKEALLEHYKVQGPILIVLDGIYHWYSWSLGLNIHSYAKTRIDSLNACLEDILQ